MTDHYPERSGRLASVTWYGQAGFRLAAGEGRVLIDPFSPTGPIAVLIPPRATPLTLAVL